MSQTIDEKTVEHIARLSKIKLSDAEKKRLIPELNNILKLVGELQKISTDGVEPLMSVLEVALAQAEPQGQEKKSAATLPMMLDEVDKTNNAEALLKIAPKPKEMGSAEAGGFFVVPKVVGGE